MIVISDEVYEFIVYDTRPMPRLCTVPGMFERTLCVSSAGKTFSVTGWKIGWVYGPHNLVDAVSRAHQFTTYSIATPLQEAVAVALEQAQTNGYFSQLRNEYLTRRTALFQTLQRVRLVFGLFSLFFLPILGGVETKAPSRLFFHSV